MSLINFLIDTDTVTTYAKKNIMARRSLGTLTLDIVAETAGFTKGMTKAERDSAKWRKQVEKDAKKVGKALAFAGTAVAVGLAGITVSTIKSAKEIERLSQVSGAATSDFQKYAAGAKLVGVEQEKLADIFKDTGDKVGDFLQTGGGPLADFFENIAPQIGVTAEQFRNLSGPQALQLYVSSLEKANLSQNEMTFFLEAIASDATMLLPLLRNGGEGFAFLGDQAQKAGAILSNDTLEASRELNAALLLLELNSTGLKNTIGSAVVPELAKLAAEFNNVSVSGAIADDFADGLATALRSIAAAAVGSVAGIELVTSSAKSLINITSASQEGGQWWERFLPPVVLFRAFKNFDSAVDEAKDGADELQAISLKYATFIKAITTPAETGGTNDVVSRIADLQAALDNVSGSGGGLDKTDEKLKKIVVTAKEIKETDFSEQLMLADQAIAIAESLRTEEEALRDSYNRRRQIILDSTQFTGDARKNLLLKLENELNEGLEEINAGFWERYLSAAEENLTNLDEISANMLSNFSSRFGDTIESIIFDATSLEDAFYQLSDGILRSTVNALGQMAGEWLAYKLVQETVQRATAGTGATAQISQAIATQQQAALASYASTAAIPIVGPAAAPGAATAAIAATSPFVASVAAAALAGVAHDGLMSVPQTGTYLLERGERVTTAETSKKLDRTLDNVQAGGATQVRINNMIDPGLIYGYMGSRDGEKVIVNAIKRNQSLIKNIR